MPSKKDSQVKLLEHSKAKIMLLKKYLEKYINIIANDGYTEKINVFDLFCGEGIYPNQGEGSPIAILKTIKELHYIYKAKNPKPINVDVTFNDIDESKIDNLKKTIADKHLHYQEFGALNFVNSDYKEILENLAVQISKYKNEKAFVFIDPYGYKDIRASEIKKLLQSKKSEVLLFLPTQHMYRFNEKGRPEALIQILEELVDLNNWTKNTSVYSFINQFKLGLKKFLGKEFFVDTFTIEKDASTVYCLFFFSSHIRGFEKMLETKWQIDDDEGQGWSYEKTGDLFSEHKINILEEKIRELFKKEKIYNGKLYEFILSNGFLPKHIVEVLTSLQENNEIEVLSDNNEKIRKKAFYISYENYKKSPNKVYFNIK